MACENPFSEKYYNIVLQKCTTILWLVEDFSLVQQKLTNFVAYPQQKVIAKKNLAAHEDLNPSILLGSLVILKSYTNYRDSHSLRRLRV